MRRRRREVGLSPTSGRYRPDAHPDDVGTFPDGRFLEQAALERSIGGSFCEIVNPPTDAPGGKPVLQKQIWLTAQKEALQSAINGAPLETSLAFLIEAATSQMEPKCRGAFFLADAEGKTLRHVVGMPEAYAQCVDGFKISADSLACGLAVAQAAPVITPDVRQEPRWLPWLWLAEQFDFRACWSFPVETAAGKCVGTLALYFREPYHGSPQDRELVATLVHTAGILVFHAQSEAALRGFQEQQTFLLKLADTVRPLTEAAGIQGAATRLLREHLDVGWCYYLEYNPDETIATVRYDSAKPGLASLSGTHDHSDSPGIPALLRSGASLVLPDLAASPMVSPRMAGHYAAIGLRSVCGVPLIKNGRLVATLAIADTTAHAWSETSILLLGDVAERIWLALERSRAEAALRHSESMLQKADQRKNHFLAMLGHELRNPLAAIHAGLQLLASPKAKPESRERALPAVIEQTAHMERLVDDLLDVTRIVQGRVNLRPERVVVQDVLRQAIHMCSAQTEAGKFDLAIEWPETPLRVTGDQTRLVQIFTNLLDNAQKYSGAARRIELRARPEAGNVVVRIRDHGVGMSADFLPRVFEPFVQANPGLTLQAGMGLGLAVVRQLVRLHGGEVRAASEGEGLGSEFTVSLPAAA